MRGIYKRTYLINGQLLLVVADFGIRLYQPHPTERWELLWGMSRADAAWMLWKNRRQVKRTT